MGVDPLTLGLVGLGAQALGSVVKGAGDWQANQYQAKVADQNAQLATAAAQDSTARGQDEATRIRSQADQLISQQRNAYASGGVDLSSGSPADVFAGTRALSERDITTVRNNAAREAWGYQVRAQQFRDEADLDRGAGGWNAATTALTTASNVGLGLGNLPWPRPGKK